MSLGNTSLGSASDVQLVAASDVLIGASSRVCLEAESIINTAALVQNNSALTSCTGLLLGISTDSDGDVTPSGPIIPGSSPSIDSGDVSSITSTAQTSAASAQTSASASISTSIASTASPSFPGAGGVGGNGGHTGPSETLVDGDGNPTGGHSFGSLCRNLLEVL
jgi:hypothetical protein